MATITTDTFLDSGTARTAGEAWILNGAKLTVRTDTRWHVGAPASMTGTLGSITVSATLGGGFDIVGTNVRWLQFDTGSGTVPAIGTTITQGGVSGYLLGVWADYTSAPTAVGASMPATGYIKFREVTGGPFSAGALSGISANALGADVVGWLEVVMDQSTTFTTSAIGTSATWQGAWFELGTTSGSAHQLVQLPTNGGGTATPVTGLSIETSPGSGVYEWYPAQAVANGFTSANINTDLRNKIVCHLTTGGAVRIGGDGTTAIGFTPAAGCKIRVPNIFLRTCTTGARATNTAPTNMGVRPVISGSNSPGVSATIDKVSCDWYMVPYFSRDFVFTNSMLRDSMLFGFNLNAFTVSNILVGTTGGYISPCLITIMLRSGSFTDLKLHSLDSGSANHLRLADTAGVTFSNIDCIQASSLNNGRNTMAFTRCANLVFNTLRVMAGHFSFISSSGLRFNDVDYIDHSRGATQLFGTTWALFYASAACTDIVIDGLTWGLNGTLTNVHPYGRILETANCSKITLRNAGTYSSPLYCGSTNATAPSLLHYTSNDSDIKMQRCYFNFLKAIQSGNSPNLSNGLLYEHVYGASGLGNQIQRAADGTFRAINFSGNTSAVSAPTSLNAGFHWSDFFSSSTAGGLTWLANAVSSTSAPYNTLSVASATSGFTQIGTLSMKTSGDYLITETPYFIKGHTAFANSSATVTATGSYTYEYQIDTGSGWNGTWKTINGTNLSGETISPSTGFKLKMRITATASNTTNLLTRVTIATVSTATAQENNLYPLDTVTLSFEGLQPGSEVRVYAGSDPATATEIGGTESTGTTYSFTHSSGGTAGVIVIFAMGYQPFYLPYTFKSTDDSILIQQVVDRNYVNPV